MDFQKTGSQLKNKQPKFKTTVQKKLRETIRLTMLLNLQLILSWWEISNRSLSICLPKGIYWAS